MANIKKLPLFVRCVIQNFPFIEEDFDALTNYQLISKVVEFLNKVITSQNEVINVANDLQEAFQQLHDYVENYFDNLDVQEEINNKLDEMAEDGTLSDIIAQYLNSVAIFGYDTVADMKASSSLIEGSFAKTMGYYSANDGGGAFYIISNSATGDEYETLDNGKVANIVSFNHVTSIKSYIKYTESVTVGSTTFTDWKPAFDKMAERHIKAIYLPEGTYQISDGLVFDYPVKIYGDGNNASFINLVSSDSITSDAIIELSSTDGSELKDLCVNGVDKTVGKTLEAGVYIHFTDNVCIDNITIKHINGDGLKTLFSSGSNHTYDAKISKVTVFDCSGNGFAIGSTDNFFSECVAHHVQKHGFYFTRGNHVLSGCKAYWTGTSGDETTGDGFYLETDNASGKIAHKIRMVNCEAQECGRYGFTLINTNSCQLENAQADTCGMYCSTIVPYGFYLQGNQYLKIDGNVINQGLTGWIKVPVYFNGGLCNNIKLRAEVLPYSGSNKYFDKLYNIFDYNGTNTIKVNNEVCLYISENIQLYNYDMGDAPTGFTKEGNVNFLHNYYVADHINESYGLGIEYTTSNGTTINNKIYKDITLDFRTRFNHAALSYEGKTSDNLVLGNGRLRFYDEDNSELKQLLIPVTEYSDPAAKATHWQFRGKSTEIPDGTAKIRIEFFINKRTQNTSGTSYAYFKNAKVVFYNEEV